MHIGLAAFILVAFRLAGTAAVRLCDVADLEAVHCPPEEHGVDWVTFLKESCKHCAYGRPCSGEPSEMETLLDIARKIVNGDGMESQNGFQCVHGLLAAVIMSSQYFLMKTADELLPMLSGGDKSLAPFPFTTSQWSLYTNMIPVKVSMCDRELEKTLLDHYVPKAHPEDSGVCGIVYTDTQLIRRCRARRHWSGALLTEDSDKQVQEAMARRTTVQSLQCPDASAISLGDDLSRKLNKYSERAGPMLQCQSKAGMWRREMSEIHKCILITVAHLLDFRPGQMVLDWGSGCGHKLSWAKQLFDVSGFGLDVEGAAVEWAKQHSVGNFCHADGRNLSWIPDEHFDHVISYAALYHLTIDDQCDTGIQLVKKLRIGGKAFFGWNHLQNMSHLEWTSCFKQSQELSAKSRKAGEVTKRGVEVELEAIEDGFLFAPDPKVVGDTFLYQYPAYSLLIKRIA